MIQIIGSKLSQWDVGRRVSVSGDATHVHFANRGDSEAVIMEITNGEAMIPDYLMRTGKDLLAYAVKDGATLGSKAFAVRNREKPENYIYEDDQRNYIYKLIEDVETAIANANEVAQDLLEAKESGEFDGPQGEKGDAGYTPVKGVDYWTPEDEAKLTEALETANEAKETAEQAEANLIDKLCPSFAESGAIVACEPVEGYPLTVQADGASKVYRSGKNLIPPYTKSRVATGMTFKGNGDGSISITGTPTAQWRASCFIQIPPEILKGGKTYVCTPSSRSGFVIHFRWKDADGNWKHSNNTGVVKNRITWDDSWSSAEIQIYCPNIEEYNETVWLQLELGETATEYEPYVCEEFAQGEAIPVLDGVNTIWADSGEVTVTGKADPKAMFEKLTNVILALGGNI